MNKALIFLLIGFCLSLWPPPKGIAQNDSTVTKEDIKQISKKDSVLSAKIPDQLEKVKELVSEIAHTKPERILRFRTIIKRHLRIDSFYVLIDTCMAQHTFISYPVHDTIWMPGRQRISFLKRLFGHKKQRKDEMKIIYEK